MPPMPRSSPTGQARSDVTRAALIDEFHDHLAAVSGEFGIPRQEPGQM